MLTLARVIIPKHKYDCVNLLLKTLQSLPRGLPSPNLERSTRHVITHSSLPLWFQHLFSAANRCPAHLTIPTRHPPSLPACFLPAFPCSLLGLECPPWLSAVFYSHFKILLKPHHLPSHLLLLRAYPRARKTVGVLKKCLQNEYTIAMNFRKGLELLYEASERIISNSQIHWL